MNYYLATWKPENGDYTTEDYEIMRKEFREKNTVHTSWRIRSKVKKEYSKVILLRQGKVTGIFGFGFITNVLRSEELHYKNHYEIQFNNLRDSSGAPLISKNDLIAEGVPESLLNSESSGNGVVEENVINLIDNLCIKLLAHTLSDLCTQKCLKW